MMLFDSWAGVLAPSQFRAMSSDRRAASSLRLRRQFPDVPVIGFPRMAGLLIGEYARETGVNAVGLDTANGPALLLPSLPQSVAAQGNLDPLAVVAGGAAMTGRNDWHSGGDAWPAFDLQSGPRHRSADAARACRGSWSSWFVPPDLGRSRSFCSILAAR